MLDLSRCKIIKQGKYSNDPLHLGKCFSYGVGLVKAQDAVINLIKQGWQLMEGMTFATTFNEARKLAGIVIPEDIVEQRFQDIGADDD